MALSDRLAAAASELREASADPLDFYRLRELVMELATLMTQSDLINEALKADISATYRGLAGPVRREFIADYEKTGLKCAYFLIGIYEALYGSGAAARATEPGG